MGGGRGKSLTIEGEALTLVPSLILGQEVLEVVVGVLDRADFVDFIDKVPSEGEASA